MDEIHVKQKSSAELIDLLAARGFGAPYGGEDDKRTACVTETGTFARSGKSYAKIVVQVDDDDTYDYGARLITN